MKTDHIRPREEFGLLDPLRPLPGRGVSGEVWAPRDHLHAKSTCDRDHSTAQATETDKAQRLAFQRSEEHTSELQSLMRISYAVFCLKKQKQQTKRHRQKQHKHSKQ